MPRNHKANPEVFALNRPKFPGVSNSLLSLACTETWPDTPDNPSEFTRDVTAWKVAWISHQERLSIDQAHRLMDVLFDGMAQPERDTYSNKEAHAKVSRAYKQDWSSYRGDAPYAHKGPFAATVRPFEMFYPDEGDPDRLKEGWAKGFPVLPVPLGFKGGHGGAFWEHLYGKQGNWNTGGLPTDKDWQAWKQPKFFKGNTALLWGHGNANIHRLYDIEVEHREQFDAHEARDYFLQSTPCYLSKKSVHIIIMSDEIVKGQKTPNFEFRGHGNYSLIPSSRHPDSPPEEPIFYRAYNPATTTILKVANVKAFAHHYFPDLFTREFPPAQDTSRGTPTANEAEESLQDLSRQARLRRREAKFFGAKNFVSKAQALAGLDRDPDFAVCSNKIPYSKIGVLFGPEANRLPREALVDLLQQGGWRKEAERVQNCGSPINAHCWPEGLDYPEYKSLSACDNLADSCMTDTARRIGADLIVPDLAGDNRYRVVRLSRIIPLSGQDGNELREEMVNEYNDITAITARLADRKRFKPLVLGRGINTYLDRSGTVFHISVILRESEDDPGAGDAFLKELMATRLDLRLWGEIAFQKGDDLAVQLMEMTFCHLMGMADTSDVELFVAFMEFAKGRHWFQAMHWLFKLLVNLKRREPLLCPSCQRPLRWILTPAGPSTPPPADPSPPPKQARFAV